MPIIDFHCDTLLKLFLPQGRNQHLEKNNFAVDLRRLEEQGAIAQFFAIFMIPKEEISQFPGVEILEDEAYIQANISRLQKELAHYSHKASLAKSWKDLGDNKNAGKLSVFLTLEDGRGVQGKMENLKRFKEMGISLISLTWNYENCFGYPNSLVKEEMSLGLKHFGKEALGEMNDLGILIDVSHLSDGGFWDVAQISKKPFVASHSNCRALCAHPRNLSDEMIRALADKGGVQGLNFCPDFLAENNPQRKSTIDMLLQHLRHMYRIGGSTLPALGTDFDGIDGQLEIADIGGLHLLVDAMKKNGFSEEEIDGFTWKNAERVISECY